MEHYIHIKRIDYDNINWQDYHKTKEWYKQWCFQRSSCWDRRKNLETIKRDILKQNVWRDVDNIFRKVENFYKNNVRQQYERD